MKMILTNQNFWNIIINNNSQKIIKKEINYNLFNYKNYKNWIIFNNKIYFFILLISNNNYIQLI
jgi:hypothetical protein